MCIFASGVAKSKKSLFLGCIVNLRFKKLNLKKKVIAEIVGNNEVPNLAALLVLFPT